MCLISLSFDVKVHGERWVRYDRRVRIQKERNGKECFHFQGGGFFIFKGAGQRSTFDLKFFLVKNITKINQNDFFKLCITNFEANLF